MIPLVEAGLVDLPNVPVADRSRVTASRGVLRRIVSHRLVHFVLLGALVFALAPRVPGRRDIVLDGTTLDALERAQAQRLGTPRLDPDEVREVRTRAVEDEILYREALRLGLGETDNVVRQRLIQKILFLAEDLAGVSRAPTEAELRDFFERTRAQWTRPARVHLIHVYAGPDGHDRLAAVRDRVAALEADAPGTPPALGDAFPLSREVTAGRDELATEYGASFADAVLSLPAGSWSAPVGSKFGWHLVKVLARTDAGPADFEEVRGRLPLVYLVARKKRAAADFLRQAAARYRITIDGAPLADLPPSDRVAPPRSAGLD